EPAAVGTDVQVVWTPDPLEPPELPGRVHIPEDEVPGRSDPRLRVRFEATEDRALAIRKQHDHRHVFNTLDGGKGSHDGTGGCVEDGLIVDDPPAVGAKVGMV